MNKYRKQIYRITSLLCCIVLIVSLAALPASASDFYDSSLINYFDYSDIEVNYTLTQENNTINFPLFREEYIRYVDLLIFCNLSYGLSNVTLNRNLLSNDLTMVPLGSGYYRLYGQFSGGSSAYTDNPSLSFTFSSSSAYVQILSFKYSNFVIQRFKEVARMGVLGTDHPAAISMTDANTPLTFNENSDYAGFTGSIYLDNWRKYDYIDVLLRVNSVGLTSVYVDLGGIKIPFELNFFDSSFGSISWVSSDYGSEEWHYTFLGEQSTVEYISIRIDLSTIAKSFDDVPIIHFNGQWSQDLSSYGIVRLESVTGIYTVENTSVLGVWFSNLKSFMADLFGKDEPGAAQAAQSQEQLNVEINNQVSAAVSDWDVHIVEVQDGYDSGFEGAVPALSWLSSLAEGIFGNMGWFGSIYLLVGLISVYVLFLNKGGLIGRKLK